MPLADGGVAAAATAAQGVEKTRWVAAIIDAGGGLVGAGIIGIDGIIGTTAGGKRGNFCSARLCGRALFIRLKRKAPIAPKCFT